MDNQISYIDSKYIIDPGELMNLKKTHYVNTNNSIFRKAYLKYRFLVISLSLACYLSFNIIFLFILSDIIILFGGLFLFAFILFFFIINRLNIVLKFCRCPNCGSKLNNRINIKKYYRTYRRIKKDMDVFYECPKCQHKVYEDIKYF